MLLLDVCRCCETALLFEPLIELLIHQLLGGACGLLLLPLLMLVLRLGVCPLPCRWLPLPPQGLSQKPKRGEEVISLAYSHERWGHLCRGARASRPEKGPAHRKVGNLGSSLRALT